MLPAHRRTLRRLRSVHAAQTVHGSPEIFVVIAALLALAGVAGLVAVRLRQPLIIAFIGVGVVMGPVGLGWVQPDDEVALLAEVGIAVLLFLVGLKLNPALLRSTGRVAVIAGLSQLVVTVGLGFPLVLAFGLEPVTALWVSLALAFSSTIIIVKLLGDRRELEDQHGRITLGILIVQDIVVVIVMIVLTATGTADDPGSAEGVGVILAKGVLLVGALVITTRWVLPHLLHLVARSAELLVLFSVAWAVALAALSETLGFSTEVGAFLGGAAVATTAYREAIASRLVSLRDFLLLFFFVELGAGLTLDDPGGELLAALVLSAFVLVVKPATVIGVLGALGYRRRTSLLSGIALGQISEFSLILVALGASLGVLEGDAVSLVTLVGIITIGASTYLIRSSSLLVDLVGPHLGFVERRVPLPDPPADGAGPGDVILYGLGRYGSMVARELCAASVRFTAVESDPQRVAHWQEEHAPTMSVVYGDAEDAEFIHALGVEDARWVVSTIAEADVNLVLLGALRSGGFSGRVALTAHTQRTARVLEDAGVDVVLLPFTDAANHVLDVLGYPHDGDYPLGEDLEEPDGPRRI